ncbi:MAG TPA: RNA pseudouridine synthase [bacterium]|nr:RNA pseudouridine synthase [bacterium]
MTAIKKTLRVIFEDPHLIVVDKPVGQLVIPGRGEEQGTLLVDEVSSHIRKKAYVVHRIDRETSGLVAFAKDAPTHRALNLLWEGREVGKTYLGWVQGVPDPREGRIDSPLKTFGSGRVGVDPKGKPSQTIYRVLKVDESPDSTGSRGSVSLLELDLLTGRRHQIRVHLFRLGHPLLGDPLYGDPLPVGGYPRLMLHAYRLTLPWESKTLSVQVDPPTDFHP